VHGRATHGPAHGRHACHGVAVDPLFTPLRVGSRTLRNRLVMTPHGGRIPAHRYLRYLDERAGGVAMIVTPVGESIYAHRSYPIGIGRLPTGWAGDLDAVLPDQGTDAGRAHFDRLGPFLEQQVATVQARGALLVGQLHHNAADRTSDNFQPTVAPSERRGELPVQIPHVLDADEIALMIRNYVAAARRGFDAGMDGIELHSGHGYLMHRFASPYYNTRTDRYGGSAADRRRIHVEILSAVRAMAGAGQLVGIRLPGPEDVAGGLTVDDVVELATALAPYVDYVSCTRGNHFGVIDGRASFAYTAPGLVRTPPALDVARAVRAAIRIPVILTGRITRPSLAREIVERGDADLVGMARAFIADARLVEKAARGDDARIVPCIGCNECTDAPFTCTVNPAAGREAELDPVVATTPLRIVVIGAGPAGIEAATRAAANGHDVTIFEAASELGGLVRVLGGGDPARAEWAAYAEVLAARVVDAGVDVRLGTAGTVATVGALAPDHVVVATGSVPWSPSFVVEAMRVASSTDVARDAVGSVDGCSVVVVAGREDRHDPLFTARLLAERGARVVLVTEDLTAGRGLEPRTLHAVTAEVLRAGVEIRTLHAVTGAAHGTVSVVHTYTGATGALDGVDLLVVAHGRSPLDAVAAELRATGLAVTLVGDALAPRRLVHAVLDGARLGANL
jgi:2,4-dienoyl-CoA reductase-like NADH-dependent reductase (Old Yellow Enzyme family)